MNSGLIIIAILNTGNLKEKRYSYWDIFFFFIYPPKEQEENILEFDCFMYSGWKNDYNG